MEKTVSYSLAVKGIGGGAVIYPHKIGVLETAKSRSLDLSTISGLLKKINFSVFTNLPSLPAGRLNCNEKEESFDNWELTKKEKSFIVEVLWDTKFDRGSMQIFFDHPLG